MVYADSVADMAGEGITLLKSAEGREKLGQAGLEYVRHTHDQSVIARQMEAELLKIIEKNPEKATSRQA